MAAIFNGITRSDTSQRLLFWKLTEYNDSAKCFLFIEIEIQLHVLSYFYHIVLIVIRYICVTC